MLRGNYPARVDEKGRLKIPSSFLSVLKEQYGEEFFITSLNGQNTRIWPLEEWKEIEEKLADASSSNLARKKFLNIVNYYGKVVKLDKQGRLLIPPRVRESAEMRGEVEVLGHLRYLEVWNHQRFLDEIRKNPLTPEDFQSLDDIGV